MDTFFSFMAIHDAIISGYIKQYKDNKHINLAVESQTQSCCTVL